MTAHGANLTLCTTQAAARFDCLAITIEQPFKPVSVALPSRSTAHVSSGQLQPPSRTRGWDVECSIQLGAATVDAILQMLPDLR